jgi:small subunit ribosomal protein S1
VVVLEIDKNKQEISLGMKQTEVNPWDSSAQKYPPGTVVEGVVRNLANYGAFIEIEPGIDGLLHISDMSWTKKVTTPTSSQEGRQRSVRRALDVDQEKQRVSWVSSSSPKIRGSGPSPSVTSRAWSSVARSPRSPTSASSSNSRTDLEGLLHISELADHKVENPQDVVKAGDEIDVKILRVDISERKIGLGETTKGRPMQRPALPNLLPSSGSDLSERLTAYGAVRP